MKAISEKNLEYACHPETKRLFWFVFGGTRGGTNRLKIVLLIKDRPINANQLSLELGLDYKAIRHHTKVLETNNIITKVGDKYNVTFFPSQQLELNMHVFDEIASKMQKLLK